MSESSQYLDCFICCGSGHQKRLLLKSLVGRLEREMSLYNEKCGEWCNQQERQGFNQILRILFSGQSSQVNSQCRHDRFQKFLLKKLKCSKEVLNFICQRLADLLAQKSYHLELIRQQIKHVAESISYGRRQFKYTETVLSQTRRSEQEITDLQSAKRVTRASKKTLLQNNKSQLQSQRQIQNEEENGLLPSFNSLTFLPVNQNQNHLQPESSDVNLTGSYFFFTHFPYFFTRSQ